MKSAWRLLPDQNVRYEAFEMLLEFGVENPSKRRTAETARLPKRSGGQAEKRNWNGEQENYKPFLRDICVLRFRLFNTGPYGCHSAESPSTDSPTSRRHLDTFS